MLNRSVILDLVPRMPLDFLRDSPDVAFRQTIRDLRTMNPKFNAGVFESMSIPQIDSLLERLTVREQRLIDELPYGSWITHPTFVQIKMLQDGLNNLREHIEILEHTEQLVEGFTYYTDVRRFGDRVEGKTCTYLGEGRPSHWINFIDTIPIMKAIELIRHGDTNDFRRIYVEIANGRTDGLRNVHIDHITESTDDALLEMESYCDARWEGPWPWEVASPYRLGRIIEEKKQMRQQTLVEMHQILNQMLREFDEGGQEQFEIASMVRGMSDNVQAMIEKFAKLAGDAMINLRAAVMTQQGDEGAMKVEHGLTQAINGAADSLARLKVELDSLGGELGMSSSGIPMGGNNGGNNPNGGMDDMGAGDPNMGGGAPMDGMNPAPGGDEMAPPEDPMAAGGVPPMAPPGGAPERPRKKA
jgi:hypothetical protein